MTRLYIHSLLSTISIARGVKDTWRAGGGTATANKSAIRIAWIGLDKRLSRWSQYKILVGPEPYDASRRFLHHATFSSSVRSTSSPMHIPFHFRGNIYLIDFLSPGRILPSRDTRRYFSHSLFPARLVSYRLPCSLHPRRRRRLIRLAVCVLFSLFITLESLCQSRLVYGIDSEGVS